MASAKACAFFALGCACVLAATAVMAVAMKGAAVSQQKQAQQCMASLEKILRK